MHAHPTPFWLSLLCAVTVSAPTFAQTGGAAAEVLFEQGRAALAAGDLVTACSRFEASDRADPAWGARASLGACEERRGRIASAWEAFRSALRKLPPNDPRATRIQERIDALAPRLPHLELVLAPEAPADTTASEGGAVVGSSATIGIPLPFDPGAHTLTFTAAGRAPRTVDIVLAEGQSVRVAMNPGAPVGADVATPAGGAVAAPVRAAGPQSPVPWVVGGIGLASLVASAVTGAVLNHEHDVNLAGCDTTTRTCTPAGHSAADAGRTLGPIVTTTLVTGLVGVAAGAIWLGARASSRPRVGVAPVVGGAALHLEASW